MRVFPILIVFGLIGWSWSEGAFSAHVANAQGDFEWSGALQGGQTLEIRGINGSVVASAAQGREALVTAVKEAGRRGDPEDVRIELVEHADGITICAVYPSRRNRRNTCEPGGGRSQNVDDNDTEVRFTVRVPAGVRFSGHTVNGDVEVEDLAGDVSVNTVNGDVEISTRGTAQAHTVNGGIVASIGRAQWDGTLDFHTVNGSIEIELPTGVAAEVSAQTVNGSMESDFPLTVQGRWGPRRLNGKIGSGGGRLQLQTVNGSIRLRERR